MLEPLAGMDDNGTGAHHQESSTSPFSVFGFDIPGLQLAPGNWKNEEDSGDMFSTEFTAATAALNGDELLSPRLSMQIQYTNAPTMHSTSHSSAIPIANSRHAAMGPSFSKNS